MKNNHLVKTVAAILAMQALPGFAAVSADEAAKLGGVLTPFGAERAGNADGSIPAWKEDPRSVTGGEQVQGRRPDPYKADKVLYSVTAANMNQYADKLTDGVKAMLQRYPDTYRLDVYPTRRTAWAPQWVYDYTKQNAVQGVMDGDIPRNVYGGIPFPVPKTGLEAIWNHKLSWRGSAWEVANNQYQITADGKVVLTSQSTLKQRMPYYLKDGSSKDFEGYFWDLNLVNEGPPIRAGEMVVGRENVDDTQSASYIYLAGQRRVRRMPNTCCDTPAPSTAGLMTFDELSVFSGKTSLFDWKLLGKKEMLIPYNENGFLQASDDKIIKGNHLDPQYVRWELHRVWVVEATLKDGQRHQAPRSKYYLDEDTWSAVLGDRWDSKGQLWKMMWMFNYDMPELGGAIPQTFGYYDLLSKTAYVAGVMNDKPYQQRASKVWDTKTFTAQGLSAQGVR
ncbi:DUF1329 domain-containing protein [Pseudomonas promysalinigenes]|uniref:DUF1329 domain-containing protein n=1 Tax=Pseudomonas promysalinigenes TaxID=485898 RepID=UPI00272262B1